MLPHDGVNATIARSIGADAKGGRGTASAAGRGIEQEVSAWKTLHRAYDRGSVRLTEPRLADRTKVRKSREPPPTIESEDRETMSRMNVRRKGWTMRKPSFQKCNKLRKPRR